MAEENLPSAAQSSKAPDNFNAILWGAGVIAGISLVPYIGLISNFCCLGIIVGGVIAVFQYVNEYQLTVRGGEGFGLGAIAGLLGGLAYFVVFTAVQVLFDYQINVEESRQIIMALLGSDPEVRQQMEEAFRQQKAEALSITNILIGLISTLIIYPIAAGIGGAIGAALFQKGQARQSSL